MQVGYKTLVSFTNSIGKLFVQIPIPLKRVSQVPMSVYRIQTIPVPLDVDTNLRSSKQYTKVYVYYP